MYILKAIWVSLLLLQTIAFFISKDAIVKSSIPREDYGYETSFIRSNDPNHLAGSVHTLMEHKEGEKIMVYKIWGIHYMFSNRLTMIGTMAFLLYVFVAFYAIPAAFHDARMKTQ